MNHHIGLVHEVIADSETAMVSMNKALGIRQQTHGKDHTDVVGKQQIVGCLKKFIIDNEISIEALIMLEQVIKGAYRSFSNYNETMLLTLKKWNFAKL